MVFNRNNIIHEVSVRLSSLNSVYEAELVVIYLTLTRYLTTKYESTFLYTESLSSLTATFPADPLVFSIFNKVNKIASRTFSLGYIMVMLVTRIMVGDMWAKRDIEDYQYDATVVQFPRSVLNFHFWKEFDNLWQIT